RPHESANRFPETWAIIKVVAYNCAVLPRDRYGFDDKLWRGVRKGGENSAGVKPAHAELAEDVIQSKSPGWSWLAAVRPRSETPTAPRIPKPRSVKLSPLRAVRPTPSSRTHRISDGSTPPCRMRSST